MASILDRYGIKEVADVVFLEINDDGTETPVLFLDTLKISTIETTAEQTEARGGKGNAPLIIWDYGKEITVTLQDALYSPKSMAMMFGDNSGCAKKADQPDATTHKFLTRYKNIIAKSDNEYTIGGDIEVTHGFVGSNATLKKGKITNIFNEKGVAQTEITQGEKYILSYQVEVNDASHIEISAATFPGTYKVVGDTYARSDTTGKDEFFQFIIHKAKMSSENTITLEAEGDPSVFDMNLRVMRPDDGKMMELIQYNMAIDETTAGANNFLETQVGGASGASTFSSRTNSL